MAFQVVEDFKERSYFFAIIQGVLALVGIAVELVNPQYTSQTCHQCLMLGSREGERFSCLACGECHADFNAACVISLGGGRL